MTIALPVWPARVLALLAVASSAGCVVGGTSPVGRACDESRACPSPLACVDKICAEPTGLPDAANVPDGGSGNDARVAEPDGGESGSDAHAGYLDAAVPDASVATCPVGAVASSCACGGTVVSSGYCCGGTPQSGACPTSCGNGAVSSSCTCGSAVVSSGYCCGGVARATDCMRKRFDGGLVSGTSTFDGKLFLPLLPLLTAGQATDSVEGITGNYPIANTDYDALYQSETWVSTSAPATFTVPIDNGNYTAHLHFVDWSRSAAGQRKFHVDLQGARVLTDFDIISEAGPSTALVKSFDVAVANGALTVTITNSVFYAEIAALEILPAGEPHLATTTGTTCGPGTYEHPSGSGTCIDDPCIPDPCSGHGTCANDTGAFVCTCSDGYSGPTCSSTGTGRVFYVATPANGGSDSNPGTKASPFATWGKLGGVLQAGDTAYIRGGTYRTTGSGTDNSHVAWYDLVGTSASPINIFAYPGESPVLNLDNINITASYCFVVLMSGCSYVHVKGLRITGAYENTNGNVIAGMFISQSPNCTFEQCEVDNIGGYGIQLADGSNDLLFKNCDVHHCADPYGALGPFENANGFNITGAITATRITYDGCRAWKNSDDGFDFFNTDSEVTLKNCWSFWNGYDDAFNRLGDGDGFKLGPCNTPHSTTPLKTVINCVAAGNGAQGFDQNGSTTLGSSIMTLYNNTAYNNGGVGFHFGYVNGVAHVLKNNVGYQNATLDDYFVSGVVQSNNSWNGGVTVSDADFLNLDISLLASPRKPDGSLPDIDFLHLAAGSDLIDAGVDVGLGYLGGAPDLGAFETQ